MSKKNEPYYDYICIPSAPGWFEMCNEPESVIKKAVIELLLKHEIKEGCTIKIRKYSTCKTSYKFIVWNKSKTSVNFVKDDPKFLTKTITGDDILVELKKLYQYFDNTVTKINDTTYRIYVKDKNAKQFKKDFIENHKVKAKQITIDRMYYAQWFELQDDGTYRTGYYNWITIKGLDELKVKIS